MMKKLSRFFALALVASALLATASYVGAREVDRVLGKSFCESPKTPEELKGILARSLAIDKKGNKALEGCTAPINFYDAWKDEGTGMKSVADLPAFVGSFTEVHIADRKLAIWSACVRDDLNGVKVKCVRRSVHQDEKVWGVNGHAFMMGDCKNPINADTVDELVIQEECRDLIFPTINDTPTKQGLPVHLAHIAPEPMSNFCLQLKLVGVQKPMIGLPQILRSCPSLFQRMNADRLMFINCDWSADEAAVSRLTRTKSRVQALNGSFYATGTGDNVLTIPSFKGRMVICWTRPDRQIVTLGINSDEFVRENGRLVFRVPYNMVFGPSPAIYRGS